MQREALVAANERSLQVAEVFLSLHTNSFDSIFLGSYVCDERL
jgi:hypothetical protein